MGRRPTSRWRAGGRGALVAAMLVAGATAFAQPAGERPAAAGGAGPIRLYVVGAPAEVVTVRWDPRARVWSFSPPAGGSVQADWRGWHVQAAKATWRPDDQVAVLEGDVKASRAELDAHAPRLTVRAGERRAQLSGGALVVEYAVDGDRRVRRLRTLRADVIDVDEAAGVVEAEGAVRLEQEDPAFEATADRLVYDRSSRKAVLTARAGVRGRAQGYRLEGAPRVEYETQTGELVLYGPAVIQQIEEAAGSDRRPTVSR